MSLITVDIYEPDGTTLIGPGDVPHTGAWWRDEHNTPGSGKFAMHLDDPMRAAHPTLLDGRNVVVLTRTLDSIEVKRFEIQAVDPVTIDGEEAAGRWVTVSGLGIPSRTQNAVVFPALLSQASASEDRAFNFASPDLSSWGDPTEWDATFGVRQDADPTARGSGPKPWYDVAAEWVGPVDPTTNAALGRWWGRDTFTMAVGAEIVLEASGDNFFEVWLDGERVIASDPSNPYNWKDGYQFSRTLISGDHTIAWWVDNSGLHAGTNNPTAFIGSIADTDSNGDQSTVLWRTSHLTSICKTGDAPGWSWGDIVKVLVNEAQARGTTDLDHFTLGFDGDVDSNGDDWTDVQDTTLRIGTDLLKVIGQATEMALDIWTDGMSLEAAPRRGTDLTASVTFTPGVDCLAAAPTFRNGALHNVALIRWGVYWLVVEDAASITEHGRREVFLQLGTAGSIEQATSVANANFVESSQPEITIPLQTTSALGAQPYDDYNVADLITGPGLFGAATSVRVYAVTGAEGDTHITYDHDLYPETWT